MKNLISKLLAKNAKPKTRKWIDGSLSLDDFVELLMNEAPTYEHLKKMSPTAAAYARKRFKVQIVTLLQDPTYRTILLRAV